MAHNGNASISKIRCLYGSRVHDADYAALMAKRSVPEIAAYLQTNTRYSEILSGMDPGLFHREHLEQLIRKCNFQQYISLLSFEKANAKPFYEFLIRRMEVEELLTAIQFCNNKSDEYIRVYPPYFETHPRYHPRFSLYQLAHARNMEDIFECISHIREYDFLKQIPLDEKGRINYPMCETKLRTHYFNWMQTQIQEQFSKETRDALLTQVQMQVDLINLINSYRLKKYFHLSAADVEGVMLPGLKGAHSKISKAKYQELLHAKDVAEYLSQLKDTYYGKRLGNISAETHSMEIERRLLELRCRLARNSMIYSTDAAISLYAITILMEMEQQNLIQLIECVRYGKNPLYIESLLVKI